MDKKKISVMVPTYNEEANVVPMSEAIVEQFEKYLPDYDYEILFIDNNSKDNTRALIREICSKNSKIKAIFNVRNFGQFNSPYYGLTQTSGDCTISICADFQDPVSLIPKFVELWEKGYKIVYGVKKKSKENKIVRLARSIYYKLVKKMSEVEQIEHFTGFGLYDKSFIEVLRNLGDPSPFIRGIVAELGYKMISVPYVQQKRRAGKSSNNFARLYDAAMLSFTTYTKTPIRSAVFAGLTFMFLSIAGAITYLVFKIIYWSTLQLYFIPVICAVGFFASIILIYMGILGEYVLTLRSKINKRPLVIEEERINF